MIKKIINLELKRRRIIIIMCRANYLGQGISVCRATSRKVQSLPKDRAKKILFSGGIQNSSL